jgi:hypothetical protein
VPRPLRPLRPWKPSAADINSLLFVVLGLGLVFSLVGMMWSGRNPPLWLAVIVVALGLLSFRHGMKPSANTRIPSGNLALVLGPILFAAIVLTVWLLSEPNYAPQTVSVRVAQMVDEAAKAKAPGETSLQHLEERKPTIVNVDPGEVDAGFVTKYWKNLIDGKNYRTRLSGDLLFLEPVRAPGKSSNDTIECEFHRAVSGGQGWAGICSEQDPRDQSTRRSPAILSTFSNTRMEGSPSDLPGFDMVPIDNVSMGGAAPAGAPSPSEDSDRAQRAMSGLSTTEKQLVESVCLSAKVAAGPDEYDRCVEKQAGELKSAANPPDLSGLSEHDRDAVEAACSNARQTQGATAYNECVKKELAKISKQ